MVIKIQYAKCLGPFDCGKCMEVCPLGVFATFPTDEHKDGSPPNLEKFKVFTTFESICNGCKLCEKICPKKCIQVR